MIMWYVYIINNPAKNYLYIGSTKNLKKRFSEHNDGLVKSTKPYRPFKLAAYVAVLTESKARSLEKYFKTGSGKAVLKKRILADEASPGA